MKVEYFLSKKSEIAKSALKKNSNSKIFFHGLKINMLLAKLKTETKPK